MLRLTLGCFYCANPHNTADERDACWARYKLQKDLEIQKLADEIHKDLCRSCHGNWQCSYAEEIWDLAMTTGAEVNAPQKLKWFKKAEIVRKFLTGEGSPPSMGGSLHTYEKTIKLPKAFREALSDRDGKEIPSQALNEYNYRNFLDVILVLEGIPVNEKS